MKHFRPSRPDLTIDSDGLLAGAVFLPSPNFDERPANTPVTLIVVHNISLPPYHFGGKAVQRFFLNKLSIASHPSFKSLEGVHVSSHFFIRRTGRLIQFVSCDKRAWHAGVSTWDGKSRCNDFSIGIECEGSDFKPFTSAQYATLDAVIDAIRRRYPIDAITGHQFIAPGRKTDPGSYFEWRKVRPRELVRFS